MAKKEKQIVEKTENSTTKPEKKARGRWEHYRLLQCFAYFAMMLIALAMILRLIFKVQSPAIMQYFQGIGEVLAYIVCIWLGFYWTIKKKSIWWLVAWIVATVVLVVFYIFAVSNI